MDTRTSRGSRPPGPAWHCVHTHPANEQRALDALQGQGWTCYLPLHLIRANRVSRRPARLVALFPRYLFVRFDQHHDDWSPIRHTRGVASLISHAIGQPSSLRPGVIEHFIARTSSRGVVDDPGDNRPPLPVGASVNVISGALAGLSGIVRMSGAERCEVLLTLFAANVPVQVRTDDLCISV